MKLTPNKIFALLLILSFLGFVDATYLTIVDYKHLIPPCTITHGCEAVLSSSFARIYGIPLALFGVIYFVTSIVLNVLVFQHRDNAWIKRMFVALNLSGVVTAIILLYLQFIVIKALCQYCMLVELIIFLSLGFSILFLKKTKKLS
jgi:uncharacterized membrane protein